MPVYRLYLNAPLELGVHYSLPQEELHHVVRVLRCRPGSEFDVVNGKGRLATVCLQSSLKIEVIQHQDFVPPRPRILAQAMPLRNKLDWIVEKGTELGMTELWLFPGQLSQKGSLSPNQTARLHHLSIAAMKQCGSYFLPLILMKPAISDWSPPPFPAFFGSLDRLAPWITPQEGAALLVIGPEGGLSQEEMQHLERLGYQGTRLHRHILRTETAGIVGLALLEPHTP